MGQTAGERRIAKTTKRALKLEDIMDGYCERHHQPWDIKCVNGQWICECPKCMAEGLLDTFVDIKTELLPEEEWTTNSHT